ncbi:response regulator transcription factor [Clostridium sp. BSD9I1]|uniref:response regulator transcription factor n=1 Tax=Clostridium sp. BSD9I1 TaxID=2003589 RepID=UPI001647A511|nr:response regulator transcription factor [Clostridium sp. BSD9I1]MBE6066505.1 response regulator transcription factor [Clostridium lundense]
MNKKKILLVDDEMKILEVVKSYLQKEEFEVHEAVTGIEALEKFNELNPSLVILDLMLPDLTGEEVCKSIRAVSRVPIIMLTAKVEEDSILNGFDIGADDYVTKPFSPKQLVARVIALLRRSEEDMGLLSNYYSYNNDELTVDASTYEVKRDGEIINLTSTELNILVAMIKYPNKVFTREELVCKALGEDFEGFDRVIDSHIKNLRRKIERDTRKPQYIKTVHGVGYKFGGEA